MNERYGAWSVSDLGRTALTLYLASPAAHEMHDLEPVARS